MNRTCSLLSATLVHRSAASAITQELSLFPAPKALVPPFEITRKIGNAFSQTVYKLCFEKSFSLEGLIRGANEGVALIGHHIHDGNWEKMASITTTDLVDTAQTSTQSLTKEQLERIKFSKDDIVHSFLHSSIITGKNLFKLSESGNLGIYFTVVSYVRTSNSVPDSISLRQATGKYKNDLMAVNVTFARTLNPLGP